MKHSLLELQGRYRDAIALPEESLGVTDRTAHHIKLKPATHPVYVAAYRLPHSQKAAVDNMVQDMLDQGVIQNSCSPRNSPLFLVPKKDKSFRPVIDFRRVNDVTVEDHYPLPVLKDLLMSLGRGNKIFSSLDLIFGYWQVAMAPDSWEVTAYSTPGGHYEFLKMPMGLKGASLTFQRLINDVFAGMLGKHVFACLDDIIVTGKNPETHLANLDLVFQRLQAAGLEVKLTKCEFLRSKINFLGHTVDGHGIHTDESKVLYKTVSAT